MPKIKTRCRAVVAIIGCCATAMVASAVPAHAATPTVDVFTVTETPLLIALEARVADTTGCSLVGGFYPVVTKDLLTGRASEQAYSNLSLEGHDEDTGAKESCLAEPSGLLGPLYNEIEIDDVQAAPPGGFGVVKHSFANGSGFGYASAGQSVSYFTPGSSPVTSAPFTTAGVVTLTMKLYDNEEETAPAICLSDVWAVTSAGAQEVSAFDCGVVSP